MEREEAITQIKNYAERLNVIGLERVLLVAEGFSQAEIYQKDTDRYFITFQQIKLIADLYNNSFISASVSIFEYGFHQVMQYIRISRKGKKVQ